VSYAQATRIARANRNISQKQLAELAGCSVSTVSLIESGKREPSAEMRRELARALDVPQDLFAVLAGDADMPARDATFIGRRLLKLLTEGGAS
jgi:transcriptional regulator with XRE-family HTH domain